jgi:23S rRNA pseudouridine1911/1915/1917 synthase
LSTRTEFWIVQPDAVRVRLDRFLLARIHGESRSQIQNWIRKGYVRINELREKTGYLTRLGDRIVLNVSESVPEEPYPEDIPLDVLFEDKDLAVINKPAGLVCHSGAGNRTGTLVNALIYRMGTLDTGNPERPGIVHRLDKFTSGVMLIAKNRLSHRRLAKQFKNRQVKKEYLALVYGHPSPSRDTINVPLGRDPQNRKKMSTRAHRKRTAITHYVLEKDYGPLSMLRIQLETGRTHQIRVHLAHRGHPIVGDSLYGAHGIRNLSLKFQRFVKELQRPFLHSHRLEFHHPQSGDSKSFNSPLSPELENFLSLIKAEYDS